MSKSADQIMAEYARSDNDGARLTWSSSGRLWSVRDKVMYNSSRWKECYNGRVLVALATTCGEATGFDIGTGATISRLHKIGRKIWFGLCDAVFETILESAPVGDKSQMEL